MKELPNGQAIFELPKDRPELQAALQEFALEHGVEVEFVTPVRRVMNEAAQAMDIAKGRSSVAISLADAALGIDRQ